MNKKIICIHNLKAGGSSIQEFLKLKYNNDNIRRIKITKCYTNNAAMVSNKKVRYIASKHKELGFRNWLENLLNLTFKDSIYHEEEIMKKFDIGFISARIFLAIYGSKINLINNGDDLLNNINKMSNIDEFIKIEDIKIKKNITTLDKITKLDKMSFYNKDLFELVKYKERYILDYFNYNVTFENN